MHQKVLVLRFAGFLISLLLTLASYFIIVNPALFHFKVETAVLTILILAVIQSLVQLIFFLDVWHEKGPPWNLTVFVSTISIIFIIIFFSIWIMDHLNYHLMMP